MLFVYIYTSARCRKSKCAVKQIFSVKQIEWCLRLQFKFSVLTHSVHMNCETYSVSARSDRRYGVHDKLKPSQLSVITGRNDTDTDTLEQIYHDMMNPILDTFLYQHTYVLLLSNTAQYIVVLSRGYCSTCLLLRTIFTAVGIACYSDGCICHDRVRPSVCPSVRLSVRPSVLRHIPVFCRDEWSYDHAVFTDR